MLLIVDGNYPSKLIHPVCANEPRVASLNTSGLVKCEVIQRLVSWTPEAPLIMHDAGRRTVGSSSFIPLNHAVGPMPLCSHVLLGFNVRQPQPLQLQDGTIQFDP